MNTRRLTSLRRLAPLLAAAALAACASPAERLEQRYAEDFRALKATGFARGDAAPSDAPWGPDDLARNFARVVHAHDHESREEQPLVKWRGPILYRFIGGAAGPTAAERTHMAALARRLSVASGLEVRPARTANEANVIILYADADERSEILRALAGDDDKRYAAGLIESLQQRDGALCVFETYQDIEGPDEGWTTFAMTVIRAELPDEWRLSCLDEEVTQILGPQYDHDQVRPSLFNDDEEFLYLTDHDEAMLRLIYDPRLRPGMRRAQTTPIVRTILSEGGYPGRQAGS